MTCDLLVHGKAWKREEEGESGCLDSEYKQSPDHKY